MCGTFLWSINTFGKKICKFFNKGYVNKTKTSLLKKRMYWYVWLGKTGVDVTSGQMDPRVQTMVSSTCRYILLFPFYSETTATPPFSECGPHPLLYLASSGQCGGRRGGYRKGSQLNIILSPEKEKAISASLEKISKQVSNGWVTFIHRSKQNWQERGLARQNNNNMTMSTILMNWKTFEYLESSSDTDIGVQYKDRVQHVWRFMLSKKWVILLDCFFLQQKRQVHGIIELKGSLHRVSWSTILFLEAYSMPSPRPWTWKRGKAHPCHPSQPPNSMATRWDTRRDFRLQDYSLNRIPERMDPVNELKEIFLAMAFKTSFKQQLNKKHTLFIDCNSIYIQHTHITETSVWWN